MISKTTLSLMCINSKFLFSNKYCTQHLAFKILHGISESVFQDCKKNLLADFCSCRTHFGKLDFPGKKIIPLDSIVCLSDNLIGKMEFICLVNRSVIFTYLPWYIYYLKYKTHGKILTSENSTLQTKQRNWNVH